MKTTLERMLAVLDASLGGGGGVTNAGARSGSSRSNGRRGRKRRVGRGGAAPESLENRLTLDVSGFSTDPIVNGGRAIITLEGGDDLFVQKVATVPQRLMYANNSSFLGFRYLPDPVLFPNTGIDNLADIYISTGRSQTDVGIVPDSYPLVANVNAPTLGTSLTEFSPLRQRMGPVRSATIRLAQADGVINEWTVQNNVITAGPGFTTPVANSGYAVPTRISVQSGRGRFGSDVIQVIWDKSTLPFAPELRNLQYDYFSANLNNYLGSVLEESVKPTAGAQANLTLPSAAGTNSGINPQSFRGTLTIDGNLVAVTTDGLPQNNLVFTKLNLDGTVDTNPRTGNQLGVAQLSLVSPGDGPNSQTLYLNTNPTALNARTVIGRLNVATRSVELTFNYEPGPVLLSATYSVWETSDKPANVTVYAGLDITNQVAIDLLPPGSTINVDSPIIVRPSLPQGDVSLWATNVYLNSKVQANDRLQIGDAPSLAIRIPTTDIANVTLATATASINDGLVEQILPVQLGEGYSAAQPPRITIAFPEPTGAAGRIGFASPGSVIVGAVGLTPAQSDNFGGNLPQGGFSVIFSQPEFTGTGSRRAQAVVSAVGPGTVSQTSRVTQITVTDGGFGYRATASFTVVNNDNGNVVARGTRSIISGVETIDLSTRGFGYDYDPKYPYDPRTPSPDDEKYNVVNAEFYYLSTGGVITGPDAPIFQFKILPSGKLSDTPLPATYFTGANLNVSNVGVRFASPRPYDGPDDIRSPRRAVASVIVNPTTSRVSAVTILDPGSGYGLIPEVTLDPPTPSFDALRPFATSDGNSVRGVSYGKGGGASILVGQTDASTGVMSTWQNRFRGANYAVNDVVGFRQRGEPQTAWFLVTSVDSAAGAQSLKLLSGGSEFKLNDELQDFVGTAGLGFSATFATLNGTINASVANAGRGFVEGDLLTIQIPNSNQTGFTRAYLRVESLNDFITGDVASVSVVAAPPDGIPDGTYNQFTGSGLSAYVDPKKFITRLGTNEGDLPVTVKGSGFFVGDFVTLASADGSAEALFKVTEVDNSATTKTSGGATKLVYIPNGTIDDAVVDRGTFTKGVVITQLSRAAGYGFQTGSTYSPGVNYRSGDILHLIDQSATQPDLYVRVAEVDTFGGVTQVYTLDPADRVLKPTAPKDITTLSSHNFLNVLERPAGYGYKGAPAVSIDNPFDPLGVPAIAEAVIDPAGRVVGTYLTNPGANYLPGKVGVQVTVVKQRSSVETCEFNAEVGAAIYDITVADDVVTPTNRSTLIVTSTGSLRRLAGGTAPSDSIIVRSSQGDILVEGQIAAQVQSYVLQSRRRDQLVGPYRFSTTSTRSNAKSGQLSGGEVTISLGQDLDTPDVEDRVAFNEVTLQTNIDSIRIRAATRQGATNQELSIPFPYRASITEIDSLAVDAVAKSSFPLTFDASGTLQFNAVLNTAGDVALRSSGDLSLTANVTTTRGNVNLEADGNVTVSAGIQATGGIVDDTKDDIVIQANTGSVFLNNGLIQALNGVRVVQSNQAVRYTGQGQRALAPSSTTQFPLTVPSGNAIIASDLNVQLSITHPNVGQLEARLISPSGARYVLFKNGSLSGANLTQTVFDTEEPFAITQASAPYTGSYRPADSLAKLSGFSTAGTWTLEIVNGSATQGSLGNFQLIASNPRAVDTLGVIAGTAMIAADRLTAVATGSVGNPIVLPSANDFYLRTQVNSVSGRASGNVAIYERDAVTIDSFRSPGRVTLRADGCDVWDDQTQSWQPALQGDLVDATVVSVSTPNGSVDMQTNTADTIFLGHYGTIQIPATGPLAAAYGMQAAGSVRFRSSGGSTKGELVILDAPFAGGNARTAALAQNIGNLPSYVYAEGVPSKVASSITLSTPWQPVPNATAKVGDRILLTGNSVETKGSAGKGSLSIALPLGAPISSLRVGMTVTGPVVGSLKMFSDETKITNINEKTRVVTISKPVVANLLTLTATPSLTFTGESLKDSLVVSNIAAEEYSQLKVGMSLSGTGIAAGTKITAIDDATNSITLSTKVLAIPAASLVFDSLNAAGVYAVMQVSGGKVTKLSRAADSDTADEMPTGTIVAISNLNQPKQFYRVKYDQAAAFGKTPISVTEMTAAVMTDLGSDDPTDQTTFVISTNDGDNSRSGSLGKMLSLIQASLPDSGVSLDGRPLPTLQFATSIPGPILLDQELPLITKPLVIDGNSRYAIPGTTAAASNSIIINGLDILRDRTGAAISKTVSTINGLSFQLPASATASAGVTNLSIGGFLYGSAIRVDSVGMTPVTINKVNVGFYPAGTSLDRPLNRIGVEVTGNPVTLTGNTTKDSNSVTNVPAATLSSVSAGMRVYGSGIAYGTTVDAIDLVNKTITLSSKATETKNAASLTLSCTVAITNSTIASAIRAGVAIGGNATAVQLTGNTIGLVSQPNTVGVEMTSAGTASIGQGTDATNVNKIQYNQTGMKLMNGSSYVVNNEIAQNTNGILIMGGRNVVSADVATSGYTPTGTLSKNIFAAVAKYNQKLVSAGAGSNLLHSNKEWGINVWAGGGTDSASGFKYSGALIENQFISGNYLGYSNGGRTASGNGTATLGGNIAYTSVSGVTVTSSRSDDYAPDTKTGKDGNGNVHYTIGVITKDGPPPPPPPTSTVRLPWRRRV